jgi:hypothetical protein
MNSGQCFELNHSGAQFWSLLSSSVTLVDVCEALQRHFSVSRDVVERDVLALAEALGRAGLIEVHGSSED